MPTQHTPSVLADDHREYDTAQAAAVDALRGITEQKLETGGGILYNPDTTKYAYTGAVGQDDGSHFQAVVHIPSGWKLAGIYHTHPAGAHSTVFSPDDVQAANTLKVPSYILPMQDNVIRKFDPSDPTCNRVVRNGFDPTQSYANGVPVEEGPIPDGIPKAHPGTVLMPKAPSGNVQGSMQGS